jgi:hypothetical protein
MKYTLPNGKNVNIPDKEIEKNMKLLEISKEEAVEMWLEDEGYLDNEEQNELDEKAKKVKIDHGASAIDKTEKKEKKPREIKVSDEKQALFGEIVEKLAENGRNYEIVKENKLICVKIGEKTFKIDLIEQRQPKK